MQIFKRISKPIAAVATVLVTTLFASAAMAIAPAQTREGYVAQTEPICKKSTQAIERTLRGVKGKIKGGQLKAASGQFTKAANSYAKGVRELRAVQQPTEDSAKLTKWLKQLDAQTELLRKMAKALKEGKKTQVAGFQVRLVHNSEVANNLVLGFDFDNCLINSAKFS